MVKLFVFNAIAIAVINTFHSDSQAPRKYAATGFYIQPDICVI